MYDLLNESIANKINSFISQYQVPCHYSNKNGLCPQINHNVFFKIMVIYNISISGTRKQKGIKHDNMSSAIPHYHKQINLVVIYTLIL